jgi:transketolase
LEAENICAAGAYELLPADNGEALVSIFASGSEVAIAAEARKVLAAHGVAARVVSVPCLDILLAATGSARRQIIGRAGVNIAIEAGIRQGWDGIIGTNGIFIGMSGFGASGPYQELYKHFGITAEHAAAAALRRLGKA